MLQSNSFRTAHSSGFTLIQLSVILAVTGIILLVLASMSRQLGSTQESLQAKKDAEAMKEQILERIGKLIGTRRMDRNVQIKSCARSGPRSACLEFPRRLVLKSGVEKNEGWLLKQSCEDIPWTVQQRLTADLDSSALKGLERAIPPCKLRCPVGTRPILIMQRELGQKQRIYTFPPAQNFKRTAAFAVAFCPSFQDQQSTLSVRLVVFYQDRGRFQFTAGEKLSALTAASSSVEWLPRAN